MPAPTCARWPASNTPLSVTARNRGSGRIGVGGVWGTGVAAIDVGGGKIVKALPVPGHTPGSYAFLYEGVLFVGDTMTFKQGRLDKGPSLFDSDSEQLKASVRNLKAQLAGADIDAVCAGHGGCTPIGLGRTLFDDFVGRVAG